MPLVGARNSSQVGPDDVVHEDLVLTSYLLANFSVSCFHLLILTFLSVVLKDKSRVKSGESMSPVHVPVLQMETKPAPTQVQASEAAVDPELRRIRKH